MKKNLICFLMFAGCVAFAQVDLTSNLMVCMPFKGNANDFSGNNRHGVATSVTLTTDRYGAAGNAYQFDRNNDSHIAVNSFSNIAPTNELTIAMWAKSDITTSNCLFIIDPDVANDRCVGCAQYLNGSSTMMVWDYGDIAGTGRIVVQNIPTDITNWHHYVYVISQSGNIKKTYLDGTMNYSGPYTMSVANKNKPFFIGGGYSNGSSGKIMWSGKIDDVCIFNRALTQAEVTALYTATALCSVSTPTTSTVTVSVAEQNMVEEISVYPTISDGIFHLTTPDRHADLEVLTMEGKMILSQTLRQETQTIDLSDVPSGIYLLKIKTQNNIHVQKIIRN